MRVALCSIIGLVFALSATAQDFKKGVEAYQREDYEAALAEWRPLAEQGAAAAQYNLGQMYSDGKGMARDDGRAMTWYRKAAEQGHLEAQTNVGFMYSRGRGVKQDFARAIEWYRKAAEQGYADAQYDLGYMYDKGRGVPARFCQGHGLVPQGRGSRRYHRPDQYWRDVSELLGRRTGC